MGVDHHFGHRFMLCPVQVCILCLECLYLFFENSSKYKDRVFSHITFFVNKRFTLSLPWELKAAYNSLFSIRFLSANAISSTLPGFTSIPVLLWLIVSMAPP